MAKADGGELIARVMRENRVKYCFAINGGHLFPILGQLRNHDIKLIHMRHEQATAYAADAYARTSGEVGVCMVTAGCGLTNAVTGLCVAGLTNSAVVCISGQHPNTEDHLGSFQEAYGSEVVDSFSKFTKRVTDWSTIQFDLRSAFREAISPPQGVALFEIPQNILYHHEDDAGQRKGAREFTIDDVRSAGDPSKIDRAIEMLVAAERPLIACGDGVFWSQAGAEMREFVELTNIPIYARRAGQGVVSEEHPLAIRGAFKKPFTGGADVVLAIGFRFWSGEHFGQPPTWTDKAKYIQVDPVPTRIGWQVNADLPMVGDPKIVLQQMIKRIKELKLDFSKNKTSPWVKQVWETRQRFDNQIKEQNAKVSKNQPIHPARLCEDLITVLDKNATTVIDSFTLSGWMSRAFTCRFMGQVVDAGPLAPVGHGVGMGYRCATRAAGSSGGRDQRRRRTWNWRLGHGDGRALQAARDHGAVEQQFVGSEFRSDARAQGPHRSVQHAAEHPLRQNLCRDGMSWRAGRDRRSDKAGAGARVQVGQAGADQRDRRRGSRQRDSRRQPARLDRIELSGRASRPVPSPCPRRGLGRGATPSDFSG